MPAIVTSWSFFTTSRRSSSRSLLKRPVTRCLTGWSSGANRQSAASSRIISVHPEEGTVDQFVHERADAAALDLGPLDDLRDVVAVAERNVAADGIARALF